MVFRFRDIQIFYRSFINNPESLNVVFLHGFTGSGNDWGKLVSLLSPRYNYYFPDLPGCGGSDHSEDTYLYSQGGLTELISVFCSLVIKKNILLCGYSMGGRVALSSAAGNPNSLAGLILESTSPGITDETERRDRIKSDSEWIKILDSSGIEEFVDKWMNSDLFRSLRHKLPQEEYESLIKNKLTNRTSVLSQYLREFGTGVMQPLWKNLSNFIMPVLLISGEEDTKFTRIMGNMKQMLPAAEHTIVKGAGHNVHLEKPELFTELISKFLSKIDANYEKKMEKS